MKDSIIKNLIKEIGTLKWCQSVKGIPGDGWFLYETAPLPPKDEIEAVISDIIYARELMVDKGKVYHDYNCHEDHQIEDSLLRKVINSLTEEKYQIAVYPNLHDNCIFNDQAIAISIEPEITLSKYPDHPQLLIGDYVQIDGKEFYLPSSLCYRARADKLPENNFEKLLYVFKEITIWLLRHQVWKVLNNENDKGKANWIGLYSELVFKPDIYLKNLNPLGKCRCGNSNTYMHCHMLSDIADVSACTKEEAIQKTNFFYEYCKWFNNVLKPQNETLEKFRLTF